MSGPSPELVFHELMHLVMDSVEHGDEQHYVAFQNGHAAVLQNEDASLSNLAVGGIAQAMATSSRPASIAKGLLQNPLQVGEIVLKLNAAEDHAAMGNPHKEDLARAVRAATFTAYACLENFRESSERIAEDIGDKTGVASVNYEGLTEYFRNIVDAANGVANIPSQLFSLPGFIEDILDRGQHEPVDLKLDLRTTFKAVPAGVAPSHPIGAR